MEREIQGKVKYGWLHSRGHAKMKACVNYTGWRTKGYWEPGLNEKN